MGFFSKKPSKSNKDSQDVKEKAKDGTNSSKPKSSNKLKEIKVKDKKASKSKKHFEPELLISDIDYVQGDFKIGLAQKFTLIGEGQSADSFQVEVEHYFNEGEKLPQTFTEVNSKEGDEEHRLASQSGMQAVRFEVPRWVIEKARDRHESENELFEKVQNEDLEYFKSLDLKNKDKKSELKMRGKLGNTLLHIAVRKSSIELVKFLIENAELDIYIENDLGNTPLMELVSMRKPHEETEEILEYLLSVSKNKNKIGEDLTKCNKSDQNAFDIVFDPRLKMILEREMQKRKSISRDGTVIANTNPLDQMFVTVAQSEEEDDDEEENDDD